jgi:putative aldouronate transport system substrate-binding protein
MIPIRKKWLTWCAILLLSSAVLGCTGTDSEGLKASPKVEEKADPANELSEKLTITWMTRAFEGGGWPDDHPMIQELNNKFNVDLKIEWVSAEIYKEKMAVLAASNEFPDIFLVLYPDFNRWKKQGLFMDVKPLLDQYPNLANIPDAELKALNPKGRVFGFPFYITQARDTLTVREDWLKKLDLAIPKTLDEFYEVAKAFTTKDPDGNGIQDTSGFTFYMDDNALFRDVEFILAGFGLRNQWRNVEGKLIPYQTQVDEWKQVLTFLNKAYKEGVLDKDFAINKVGASTVKFESGKVGFAMLNPNQFLKSRNTLTKLVPNAVNTPMEPPKGQTGLTGTSNLDMLDKNVINSRIDPKKQRRILMMLDYFLSPAGADFIKHGIEGVHYKKITDDKYERLQAANMDRQNLINNWIFRPFNPGIQMYKWEDPAQHQLIKDMFAMNEKHKWSNPAAGLESETLTRKGAKLNANFAQAVARIIMGDAPIDSIETASAEWMANGGKQIMEEINRAYKE